MLAFMANFQGLPLPAFTRGNFLDLILFMLGSWTGYPYPPPSCTVDLQGVLQLASDFWEIFLWGVSKVVGKKGREVGCGQ